MTNRCMTSMKPAVLLAAAAWLALLLPAALGQTADSDREAKLEFFEKKIRPLLVDNCYTCHSADTNSQGGLRVDDRNGLAHRRRARSGRSCPASRRRAC